MRLLIPLLLGAATAVAEDLPLIRAAGTSLATFEIELRLEAVDRGSAEGLAKSFARLEEEQHGVRRRFAELVRDAHLDLLRAFYTKEIVDKQAETYKAVEQRGYRCEVLEVTQDGGKATARLRRTYVEAGKEREEASEIDLVEGGGRWLIAKIRDRGREGRFVERGLGTPPVLKRVPLLAPEAFDLTSPKATVVSVRNAILVFGAHRDNAALALTDRFFDILEAFYGEEVARKARASRPSRESAAPAFVEIGGGVPRLADLMRVEVTLTEEVEGKPGQRAAIANAAFDLRADAGTWKVVGEYVRPGPDMELTPVLNSFALFFLVRR